MLCRYAEDLQNCGQKISQALSQSQNWLFSTVLERPVFGWKLILIMIALAVITTTMLWEGNDCHGFHAGMENSVIRWNVFYIFQEGHLTCFWSYGSHSWVLRQ